MAWIIAIVLILVILGAYFGFNRLATKRIADKHGGEVERALGDESEPIPSAHLITDDDRPLGDVGRELPALGVHRCAGPAGEAGVGRCLCRRQQ